MNTHGIYNILKIFKYFNRELSGDNYTEVKYQLSNFLSVEWGEGHWRG